MCAKTRCTVALQPRVKYASNGHGDSTRPPPPLSRLTGWPHNVGPFSGHPSGPPSLVPHSGVPGWGAQILGRFLAPNPGPLFKARMRPRNSTPADLALSVGPILCTVHAGESRPPVPSQQPGCLSHRPTARTVTMSLPLSLSFGRVAVSTVSK